MHTRIVCTVMTIASRCKANITAWKISPNDSTLRDTERSTRWLTLTTPYVSCYDMWEEGRDISEGSSCLPNTPGGGQRRSGVGRTEWVGEYRQSLSEPSQPYNLEIKDTTSSCQNNSFKWLTSLYKQLQIFCTDSICVYGKVNFLQIPIQVV